MLPTPLFNLIVLQGRAVLRRSIRGLGRPKGAVFFAVGVVVFVLWLVPSVITARVGPPADLQKVRLYAPLALLALCVSMILTSGGDRAIAFTPAEVDQLFPAPFTRRQLLGYKIAKGFFGTLLACIFMSMAFARHSTSIFACYIGLVLAMFFTQLIGMAAALTGEIVGQRLYSKAARIIGAGLVIAAALAIGPQMRKAPGAIADLPQLLSHSKAAQMILAPFSVYGRVITAPTFLSLAGWSGAAAAIDILLIGLIMRLDADYLEAAANAGQKIYTRVQRGRQGGGLAVMGFAARRFTIPQVPTLSGAGPIIWRQLVTAARSSRGILFALVILAIVTTPMLLSLGRDPHVVTGVVGVTAWFTLILAQMMKFDFRGDLQYIESLKTLPIHPHLIALGQLVVPVMVLTALHLILFLTLWAVSPTHPRLLLEACLLSPAFNAVVLAVENAMFLLYPTRSPGMVLVDMQGFGRNVVLFLAKMLIILIALGLAVVSGVIVHWISESTIVSISMILGVLLIEGLALSWAVGAVFSRFDVSTDIPA